MGQEEAIVSLRNLMDHDVQKFTSAESHLHRQLEKWITGASSLKLKVSLQKYASYLRENLDALEEFCNSESITSMSATNAVMKAFVTELNEKLSHCSDTQVRDACLLEGIQAINHFKIFGYGTATAFAKALKLDKYASIFYNAEKREKTIDQELSQLAKSEINIMAIAPMALGR